MPAPSATGAPPSGRRGTAVVLLLALAFLLVPLSVVAQWAHGTLLDTERYVQAVAPLARDPAVVDGAADALTAAAVERLDLPRLLEVGLPPVLAGSSGVVTDRIEAGIRKQVLRFLRSEQFPELWLTVNRRASKALVAYVDGDDSAGPLVVDEGTLYVDLAPVLDEVQARLVEAGVPFLDRVSPRDVVVRVAVAEVGFLVRVRDALRLLDALAWLLPLLAAASLAGAVLLARRWARGLLAAALVSAASLALLLLVVAGARAAYLDRPDLPLDPAAAAVVVDAVLAPLTTTTWWLFAAALLAAGLAVLAGAGRPWRSGAR